MNIVISVNKKYIEPAKVMLFSLQKHCSEGISVWLINHSINSKRLKKELEEKGIDFHEIQIEESGFDSLPLCNEELFSREVYYRILIPWLLPESVDRALWLDADIIIRNDITDFYHQDFQDKSIVACPDGCGMNPEYSLQAKKRLHIDSDHQYFNSGVLLMNLRRIRELYTPDDVFALSDKLRKVLVYPDQDILNCMFVDDVLYADCWEYNCRANAICLLSEEQIQQIKILHYYGPKKPWKIIGGSADPGMIYVKEAYDSSKRFVYSVLYVKHAIRIAYKKFTYMCSRVPWMKKLYHRIKGMD